jgi:SagB-type dehydrogenase family enzyme
MSATADLELPPPLLALHDAIRVVAGSNGFLSIRNESTGAVVPIGDASPRVARGLTALEAGGVSLDDLLSDVAIEGGLGDVALLCYYVQALEKEALIRYSLRYEERLLVSVEPIAPGFRFEPENVEQPGEYHLSRFAFCRRIGDALVLESPLVLARAVFHDVQAAAVAFAAVKGTAVDVREGVAGISPAAADSVRAWLGACGFLVLQPEATAEPEDEPRLRQWEFHDLLFHSRSRRGYHDYPIGGVFRFLGDVEPEPALKIVASDTVISLPVPSEQQIRENDGAFSAVLEGRRSLREHAAAAMTIAELGEFLWRSARVRSFQPIDHVSGVLYEATSRPYPTGGAAYELELYLTVGACDGVPKGIYHYDPAGHALHRIDVEPDLVDAVLFDGALAFGGSVPPQVLFTITSRFCRVAWKYSGMAYATTLKNVGVLYQTMYLVATAMGLAPCALGNGDTALSARAFGLDWLSESAVGEFILGRKALDA